MKALQEEGRFAVTASNTQFGESSTGTPFIQITFTTDDQQTITGWLYLSEKAFERTLEVMREVFGFDDNFDTLTGQVDGKRCSIVTEFEAGQDGKPRLKVRWVNTEGGGMKAPNPISNQSAFLRDMTRRAKMLARTTGTAPRPARPTQSPPAAASAGGSCPF
ncbi:hypothetical protein OpiT1DRAFT_03870 [Opitutaceae bacterium TAV1]|nr:hypothetical protein OpiT1DRAFT_03870 [Opitutaceae bacterium TAV1]